MRKAFAYGGAAAMTPYLLIKVSWVIAGLLGLAAGGLPVVALNLATVIMSATGVALALALARPWGMRLPGRPVLLFAWVGGGFLVPMIPYMLVSSLLPAASDATPEAPRWEYPLIESSFLGMGVCLAVALPLYLRERWPSAFAPGPRPAWSRPAAVLTLLFGAASAYWALGGPAGLVRPEARDVTWYLQLGNDALWALAIAAGAWFLGRGPVPLALAWIGSGFLFAWNAWKLLLGSFLADEAGWPESFGPAAARFALGVAAGALLLAVTARAARLVRGGAANRSAGGVRSAAAAP